MPRKTKEDTKTKEHADCDCELDKKSNAPR